MKISALLSLLLLVLAIAGCHYAITGCTGLPPSSQQCEFTHDTLNNRTVGLVISDDMLDSMRSYTYLTQNVRMDSLLPALCRAGVQIESAYYSIVYLCADARGPLPVVVLRNPDTTMMARGFTQGANGRLACGGWVLHYAPK